MDNLSIIIPVYNEEKAIKETVVFFEGFLKKNPHAEIIFVNDGSTDRTVQILGAVGNEKVKLLNHSKNKGYGASIKTGVKNAAYDYVAIGDADCSYPLGKIPELFGKLLEEDADMVVAARVGKLAKAPALRRFAKFVLRKFAEYLSGEKIDDLNSGLRVIKKEAILKFFRYLPDGFSFTTTITLSLLANDRKVVYVAIDYFKRKGRSKINPFKDPLNFLQLIIRTVMFFNPLKVFLPLGLFFVVLSFTVLVITYFLGKVMDIATIILFTTGLNLLAIGLLADLIDKRLPR